MWKTIPDKTAGEFALVISSAIITLIILLTGTASATATYSNGSISVSESGNTLGTVCSSISNNQLLSKNNNNYILNANIKVLPGGTLTINGENITFGGQYLLLNQGSLFINNSTITSTDKTVQTNRGRIEVKGNNWNFSLINSDLSYLGPGGLDSEGETQFGIYCYPYQQDYGTMAATPVNISGNKFHSLYEIAIGDVSQPVTISHNKFYSLGTSEGTAISAQTAEISYNEIYNCYNYILIYSLGSPYVHDNNIHDCALLPAGYCIGQKEGSGGSRIENNTIVNCSGDSAIVVLSSHHTKWGNIKNNTINSTSMPNGIWLQANGYDDGYSGNGYDLYEIVENNTIKCGYGIILKGGGNFGIGPTRHVLTRSNILDGCASGYKFINEAGCIDTTLVNDTIKNCWLADIYYLDYQAAGYSQPKIVDLKYKTQAAHVLFKNSDSRYAYLEYKTLNWTIYDLNLALNDQNPTLLSADVSITNNVNPSYPIVYYNDTAVSPVNGVSSVSTPVIMLVRKGTANEGGVVYQKMNYSVSITKTGYASSNTPYYDPEPGTTNIFILTQNSESIITNFRADTTSSNTPLSVSFTDLSTNGPTSWSWNFGDGTNSTQQNPTHTYSVAGNYSVNLTASNAKGTNSKLATITVLSQSVLPSSNFSNNVTQGNAPLSVQFTDQSKNAIVWDWNFGDGTNSTQQNPAHTYSAAGNYTVNLTASNANGTDSSSSHIVVSNGLSTVVAAFSASPTSGKVPLTVNFTDKSTGSPTSWKWYFGDGTNSTEQNPTHTYSNLGKYTVTLGTSNASSSNSIMKNGYINVANSLETPGAAFSASPTSGKVPLTVNFTDKSTGSPTSWKWYFGDGTNSTEQNPTHTYSNLGKYTVTLGANNAVGSNSIMKNGYINVANSLETPGAAFSAIPTSGKMPLTVNFTDKSTGSLTSWKWYFGDGTNSTEQNPTHTYNNSGQYTVTLGANNDVGSNTIAKYGYISVANSFDAPVAAFSAFPTSGNAPLTVSFTDKSTGSPTSWKWYFGDGTNSTEQSPVHIYSKAAKCAVSLTVNNPGGSGTETMSGYITVS